MMEPYSAVNYGFSFFTQNPDPDQDGCTGFSPDKTSPPAGPCPEWDGENIYLAKSSKQDAIAINAATTIEKPTSSIVAITEAVRMGRMHPSGPKRVKIVLGGWSDYARMGTEAKGVAAAKLYAKFVAHTFADGVDMDMEHLTPYDRAGDEFKAFAAFVNTLRSELDQVATEWASNAAKKKAAMQAEYSALEDWKKQNVKQYYETNFNYLDEVASNPVPYLEISWTTRFNAFLPEGNPWNYLTPDSEIPEKNYETDNEGAKLWPEAGKNIDTVNIMAYDAGGIKFDFTTILKNFVAYSGDPSIAAKINIGFEPGEQAAGGVWEGMDVDKAAAQFALDNGYGGAMIWAANPNPVQAPTGSTLCPAVAKELNTLLKPTYAWGAGKWTKCTSSGWWPSTEDVLVV
jgi:GH18 family chitinase